MTAGFVAFAFADTDTEDGAAPGKQMQSRGGLRRDRGIAATGVGDHTPSRSRRTRLRAARCPSIVHGSRTASTLGTSLTAAPKYSVVAIERGRNAFR
jgi:hypothetical protein